MKIRMKDIAREVGVSTTTISRAVNNKGVVAKKTKEKILKTINKYNYTLNGVAQSLRMKRTNTIGFIMSQIYPDPFQSMVSMYLEEEAKINDFRLVINNTLGNIEEENYAIDLFIKYRTDGIIFSYLLNRDILEKLKNNNIPFVLIERRRQILDANVVLFNYYNGIKISIEHLISKGAKKIAFIGGKLGDEVENQIFKGYKDTLIKNKLVFDNRLVYFGWMDSKTGYYGINTIYDKIKPDACIIIGDITALGSLQALYELGIKVPDDLMIISSDNTLSAFATPPITSITFYKKEIAKCSFELIKRKIDNFNIKNKLITLEPKLIKRVSTRD